MNVETLTSAAQVAALGKEVARLAGERHPVIKELGLYAFWGAVTLVLRDDSGRPVSVNSTKLGKRRKNKWEPFANWYGAYTLPEVRRRGYATQLYFVLENLAKTAECRRIKSLAGSSAGLGLHHSLGHLCWGLAPTGEAVIDAPFPWAYGHYTVDEVPPQVPGRLLTEKEVTALIKKGLRYDQKT